MPVFVGIDVAKASLAVALYPGEQQLEVGNDAAGHKALCRWLAAQQVDTRTLDALVSAADIDMYRRRAQARGR